MNEENIVLPMLTLVVALICFGVGVALFATNTSAIAGIVLLGAGIAILLSLMLCMIAAGIPYWLKWLLPVLILFYLGGMLIVSLVPNAVDTNNKQMLTTLFVFAAILFLVLFFYIWWYNSWGRKQIKFTGNKVGFGIAFLLLVGMLIAGCLVYSLTDVPYLGISLIGLAYAIFIGLWLFTLYKPTMLRGILLGVLLVAFAGVSVGFSLLSNSKVDQLRTIFIFGAVIIGCLFVTSLVIKKYREKTPEEIAARDALLAPYFKNGTPAEIAPLIVKDNNRARVEELFRRPGWQQFQKDAKLFSIDDVERMCGEEGSRYAKNKNTPRCISNYNEDYDIVMKRNNISGYNDFFFQLANDDKSRQLFYALKQSQGRLTDEVVDYVNKEYDYFKGIA